MPDSLPSPAERAVRRRIARHGPITFAEFMDHALYGQGGYYTRPGDGSDYYTSPRVHPAFGALLAVQLFHCWTLLDHPVPFHVIETGAGDGLLSRDILSAARHLPDDFADAIRYVACDRIPTTEAEPDTPAYRRLSADALQLPLSGLTGCVLSNELLDALPVHRVRMENGTLRELFVGIESDVADGYEGQLQEFAADPSTPMLGQRLAEVGITLAEGQTAEICLLLDDWAASVATVLDSGFVLTIDYGRVAADLYDASQRPHGTLVTYRDHRQTDTPFQNIGRQDITAQVDFTAARMAGERSGLDTVGNVSQAQLLTRLGLQTIRRKAPPPVSAESGWITIPVGPDGMLPDVLPDPFAAPRDDTRDWLTGLTHLARPGGLGDFRVLLQSRGVDADRAASALAWLDGEPAAHGSTPADLAAMIPAEALALGADRLRLAMPAML